MFIGHFGLGLASKKISTKPSLGTLFLAAQFIDLLWPFFLLAGIETVKIEPGNTAVTPLNFTHYPYSHGLLSVFVWALLFGIIYYLVRKDAKSSVLLGALVVSHWVLDFLTHRADLPLTPWSDYKVGLGLWNMVGLSLIVEGIIFLTGAYLYITVTRARKLIGHISLWSFLVFMIVFFIVNLMGPPPPSEDAIAKIGLTQWILIAWGYWIDYTRIVEPSLSRV